MNGSKIHGIFGNFHKTSIKSSSIYYVNQTFTFVFIIEIGAIYRSEDFKLECASKSPGKLIKTQFFWLYPQNFWFSQYEKGPKNFYFLRVPRWWYWSIVHILRTIKNHNAIGKYYTNILKSQIPNKISVMGNIYNLKWHFYMKANSLDLCFSTIDKTFL